MHSDSKKRRSFLALLFAAGDVKRYLERAMSAMGRFRLFETFAALGTA
jgi:hypothetical protein